eukprot:967-Karenia_brevis.AAC.1
MHAQNRSSFREKLSQTLGPQPTYVIFHLFEDPIGSQLTVCALSSQKTLSSCLPHYGADALSLCSVVLVRSSACQ